MAAPTKTLTLYRSILKELKSVYPKVASRVLKVKGKGKESSAYQYVRQQFRDHDVTSEKLCRSKHEMEHVASTYLCFLVSVKRQDELNEKYQGAGERSIESSAALVGLKLPKQNNDSDNNT